MCRKNGIVLLALALVVGACGGNEQEHTNTGTTNTGTTNTGTTNTGTTNNGTANTGTTNNGTTNNNTRDNNPVDADAGVTDDTGMTDVGFEEPDDSTHAPGFWPPQRYSDLLVRSGTRLTAKAVVSEEGNASLLYFDDATTGEECTLWSTATGEWHCLPTRSIPSWQLSASYSNPDCTTEAVALSGQTCANGVAMVLSSGDDDRAEGVVRLSKASGRAFRKLSNGTCEPYATSLDLSAWTVTEEVALDEFVRFSSHPLPVDDDLAVHILRGEDGSRAARGLWLRELDVAATVEPYAPAPDSAQVLRAVPAGTRNYDLNTRGRDFVNGPLVNLSCDSMDDWGYDVTDPSIPYGLLLPAGEAPPSLVRTSIFIQGLQGSRVYAFFHEVEDTATRYCSMPITYGPSGPRPAYDQRTEVDVPAGYTLYRLSAGQAPEAFPRIEKTIDTRAGGLRFEHYETVLRVPLLPVGSELYRDGKLLGSFWVDGVLRAAVPFEDAGEQAVRYQGSVQSWADAACAEPLGNRGEGSVQTVYPHPTDLCTTRGEGVAVFVSEEPREMSYYEQRFSEFGTERGCAPGNNGNPGWRSPMRRLTLPDPLVIDVPVERR
jgi:hypothetical protein